jgi:hypothetical protein
MGRVGSGFELYLTRPYRARALSYLNPTRPVNPRVRARAPDGFLLSVKLASLSSYRR